MILEGTGKYFKAVPCDIIDCMKRQPAICLLILAHSPEIGERWAQAVRDPGTQVWLSAAELPNVVQPDVIVTDGARHEFPPTVSAESATPGDAEHPPAAIVPFESEFPQDPCCSDRPGVIVVGADATCCPADVCLPADVSARELRLACRLLAEVVHLRRALLAQANSERRLAREALIDPLSGLPNRRAWEQQFKKCLASASSSAHSLCLAVLDLDHFKVVNDTSGHAVGDQVLRTVGRTLGQNLRPADFVARLGGDEFGLLLPMPNPATGRTVVDRVRRVLPAGLANAGLPAVTASAGLCFLGPDALATSQPCLDALFAAADAALRDAKSQGRDRTVAAPIGT